MMPEEKVLDYSQLDAEEETMPSRRCPHCGITATYQTPYAHLKFDGATSKRIRLDVCDNETCQCATAVVTVKESIVETFPSIETEPDELLPPDVRIAFRQALGSLNEGLWDPCVLMCRRAIEEAMRDLNATGKDLYNKIDNLAADGRITPDLQSWAHEGRLAGNLSAHGNDEKKWNTETDGKEIVEFAKWFFRYVYVLPQQLKERKERLASTESGGSREDNPEMPEPSPE